MSIMPGGALRLGLVGLTTAALASGMVARTPNRASDAAGSQMMAKDADPGWEVVTVKPADPNETGSVISISGRHVIVSNEPMIAMLKFAYGIQNSEIVQAPQWMKTERWDVSGVPDAPGKPNLPQFQHMMQKLLAERFGLKLHREQRVVPVSALTVAKGGPKLEKSADANLGPSNNGGGGPNGTESHRYSNASMPDLALMLMIYTDRPIVHQTGLQGRFDFQSQWTRDETATPTATDAPPGLFTAMQEQLGLKLEPTKAAADLMVIDAVERPEAN
jgi:uncharacterized protein (TIGR03435 family)